MVSTGTSGAERGAVADLTARRIERRSHVMTECYAAWAARRGPAGLPGAEAVADPLAPPADHVLTLDRLGPGAIRLRQGGRVIRALMGAEPAGMPLRALFHVSGRGPVLRAVERCFVEPAVVTLDLVAEAEAAPLAARMLLLPLADRAGRASKALGCVALRGPLGAAPHRFHLKLAEAVPLGAAPAPQPPAPAARLRLV
jgi:hypothetical protein